MGELSSSSNSVETLSQTLDDLTLLQVDQLDEQLNLMSQIESNLMSGFINLAKSRYINGERTVSTAQIPGEESDVQPSTRVVRDANNKLEISKNEDGSDALKWFGVLVPMCLRQSQTHFRRVLEIAVDIVNVREEAAKSLKEFYHLAEVKKSAV